MSTVAGGVEARLSEVFGEFVSQCAFFYLIYEIFDNRQGNIGFQQCKPHFAQGFFDVVFGERGFAAHIFEYFAETAGQVV